MADGTNTSTVARNALTCQTGQVGTSSGDYYAPPDRQFAPVRHGNAVKAFTDGCSAMHAMAEAIRGAQKFIFIADWQMNFDTELTGRGDGTHRGRLSELLFDAINVRGVDVRVLLYDSVEAAAYTHENEARAALYSMVDGNTPGNIEVGLQNPATGRTDAFNIGFSHHQKILVVDGKIGFVGGLDVAHGRWDDGNFDVVCDPRLHIINDHYNNGLSKPRSMSAEEIRLTQHRNDDSPDAITRVHPGFAGAYLPNMTVAIDLLKAQWNNGDALAAILDYADKAGLTEEEWMLLAEQDGSGGMLLDTAVRKLRDVAVHGYDGATGLMRTLGNLLEAIRSSLDQADLKYADAIASTNRGVDETLKGNVKDGLSHGLLALQSVWEVQREDMEKTFAELRAKAMFIGQVGADVVGRLGDYIENPAELGRDAGKAKDAVLKALADAEKAYASLRAWMATEPPRTQALLDAGRHPRMPWQDVHARLEGPAVYDICRNFMHRWNATVWQNQRGSQPVGQAITDAVNGGIWVGNKVGMNFPAQRSMARGSELQPLTDAWLDAMGGVQGLFENLCSPGGAGGVSVQIVRSSGTALHDLERRSCQRYGLGMEDGSRLPLYWNRNQPMHSIQDAMLNCIASAKAFVYLETQFLISDCGYSDAEPGRLLDTLVSEGQRGPKTPAQAGKVQKAELVLERAQGLGDAVLPGTPIADTLAFRQGVPSAAQNKLVETLSNRIIKAIRSGQGFHVYITLPVHPEGSLFDGTVLKQQYWAQQTLLRGRDSLIRRVCRAMVAKRLDVREASVSEQELRKEVAAGSWKSYLTVLNLRSYGVLKDAKHDDRMYSTAPPTVGGSAEPPLYLVTEQCYVHSKLLIVDDAVAIIGSANCNDRSLEGNGDTEIAAVIVDTDAELRDLGNGVKVVTRKFARELRIGLWKKFLGMSIETGEIPGRVKKTQGYTDMTGGALHPPLVRRVHSGLDLARPADGGTSTYIADLADSNASIYEQVFKNVPSNAMRRYDNVFAGHPSAGMDEKGEKIRRYLYAQPPDLQPAYMEVASVLDGERTRMVGRHDVAKGLLKLRGDSGGTGEGHVRGFWVTMPLEWGHGMDDPAAALPAALIAVAPVTSGGSVASGALAAVSSASSTSTEKV